MVVHCRASGQISERRPHRQLRSQRRSHAPWWDLLRCLCAVGPELLTLCGFGLTSWMWPRTSAVGEKEERVQSVTGLDGWRRSATTLSLLCLGVVQDVNRVLEFTSVWGSGSVGFKVSGFTGVVKSEGENGSHGG